MGYLHDKMMKVTRQLYPVGRAFKLPFGGKGELLEEALILSEVRAVEDAVAILDSINPDSAGFTTDDATDAERRWGIPTKSGVTFADRKAAIKRKMFYPGNARPRQHYQFMEAQLRAAGFEVRVYENRFDDGVGGWETRDPGTILGIPIGDCELDGFELDDLELDMDWADAGITLVANHIDAADDAGFPVADKYRSTFYVTGGLVDEFASVPVARQEEFRQLILQLKRVNRVGILFVNYV